MMEIQTYTNERYHYKLQIDKDFCPKIQGAGKISIQSSEEAPRSPELALYDTDQ
jgi:hypothetical protein